MLCLSMSRWAVFIAASASCTLELDASARSRAIRRRIGACPPAPSVSPGSTAGKPRGAGSKCRSRQTRSKAGPCADWSWIWRTSSTNWCAISCLRTSRTTAQGCSSTNRRDSSMVRRVTCQAPSLPSASASASTGRRMRPRKWFWLISSQVRPSSRSRAASSFTEIMRGLERRFLVSRRGLTAIRRTRGLVGSDDLDVACHVVAVDLALPLAPAQPPADGKLRAGLPFGRLLRQPAEDLDGDDLGVLPLGLEDEGQDGFARLRHESIHPQQRSLSLKREFAHRPLIREKAPGYQGLSESVGSKT